MRFKFFLVMATFAIAFMTSGNKDNNKAILGKWCNPYTYESTGEIKGFNFKKGGKCEAINVPILDLKTWEIKDGNLIIKGERINPDGSRAEYITIERIDVLTRDSLELIVKEDNPRLAFLYVRPAVAEKAFGKKKEKRSVIK